MANFTAGTTSTVFTKAPAGMIFDGDLTVARISKEVGYASVSHFISEFRGRFGVTPRAYYDAHALHRELDTQRAEDLGRATLG
jgi:AraC-like DNA-binding protein